MFDSVRTKLTLWNVSILALAIIGFAALTYYFSVRVLSRELDLRLEEMSRNLAVALEAEAVEENRADEQTIVETVNEFQFRDYQFIVTADDGRLITSTSDFKIPPQNRSPFADVRIENEKFRVFDSPLEFGQKRYRLMVFHSLREQMTFENRLLKIFLVAVPFALLLSGFGGYFLARKSLAPVVEMSEQAEKISAKNLDERLSIKNERDEIGKLARIFNDLLARLENSFERQKRFMADASHELRTPLAIVRGETEVALSKDNRAAQDYQTSLTIVADESRRLTQIVEDLFTLARADAGQFQTNFAPVYLDEIVGEAVRSMRVLAEKRNIKTEFSSASEMPFDGDESLLRRLFLNLLDNAVKYNRDGGTISVVCEKNKETFRIKIIDSGRGIPPAEQANIFERFYRVDKARARQTETETSGAGLGLSIAQWIAEIHHGRIELTSSDEKGSVFEISFPC